MTEVRSARFHYGWVVLAMGTLTVFGALGLARFGYTVVLPAMQVGLSMSNTQAGLLATVNLVGYLALSAAGGALASHLGPRRVIAAGLLVAGLSMVMTGLAGGVAAAALWRGTTGLGSGASNVPVMGMLAAWFGARRRGMAAGVAVTGSSLAMILIGPLVPRVLAAWPGTGWRVSWHLYGVVTILLSVAAWRLLRDHPEEVGLRPLGAEREPPREARPEPPGKETPAGGGLRWGLVYRSPAVWHLGLVYTAFGFSYIIYMTFFTKHLLAAGGYTVREAGSLFMLMGWVSLFCGLIWGTLSDRVGRRAALAAVYVVHGASFGLFAVAAGPASFTVSAVLFGLTAWSIPAIMAAACGDVLGARLAPAALGFITLFFGLGQAAGPWVAGALADLWGSFTPALLLASAVAFLGAAGSWSIRTR